MPNGNPNPKFTHPDKAQHETTTADQRSDRMFTITYAVAAVLGTLISLAILTLICISIYAVAAWANTPRTYQLETGESLICKDTGDTYTCTKDITQ